MSYDWSKFGFHIPEILLPKEGIDYEKWAVVACDQYTSEPEYWDDVEKVVGDAPSTLRLMLPELYLDSPKEADMIKDIRSTMDKYLADGTLVKMPKGCILVEREAEGRKRLGLVIATDLEAYDYNKGSHTLTRATEGTVIERIPPRLRIRKGAPIEMPHIMILIDDPDKSVIEPLVNVAGKVVYDTDLMLKGGHVKGTFIEEKDLEGAKDALSKLFDKAVAKYGEDDVIFQAMGDGNHSLATAKANWEEIKKDLSEEEIKNHPARFALCEIENVHDDGIVFEAIHRVVFSKGKSSEDLLNEIVDILKEQNADARLADSSENASNGYTIPYFVKGKSGNLIVEGPKAKLAVATLQNALDVVVKEREEADVDYIHGEDSVKKLSDKDGNIGFLLPAMSKFDLFPAVAADGALPRKTFSMGEANEKRYYIESRYIG